MIAALSVGRGMSGDTVSRGGIYVVDDDAAARDVLAGALTQVGYDVICFADGPALLSETRVRTPACIFLDVQLSDRSGLELLRKLRIEDCPAPILVASAHGNIPMAVDAIRSGAFDFIEKPFLGSDVVARVQAAIGGYGRCVEEDATAKILQRFPERDPLTLREREVLARIAVGKTNKETARQLGLSLRTIEGYRARIMKKLGARNATELVRRIFDQSP